MAGFGVHWKTTPIQGAIDGRFFTISAKHIFFARSRVAHRGKNVTATAPGVLYRLGAAGKTC